jgi:SAM-dependent methyltransferase
MTLQQIATVDRSTDDAAGRYRNERRQFWDGLADEVPSRASAYYHSRLGDLYGFLVGEGLSIIEIGCGTGDLLASLKPRRGVGVDFSATMIAGARERHPDLEFLEADAHEFVTDGQFDVVILSDLVNDVWDVQAVLEQVRSLCKPSTRLVLNFFNRVWQGPLHVVRRAGLSRPTLEQNWLSVADVTNLLHLAGFEVVTRRDEMLLPVSAGPISPLLNRFVVKLWPFSHAALTTLLVARPNPVPANSDEFSVSVIVPARNESGNIESIIERTPMMGSRTELIFVEGNSTDDTYAAVERAQAVPGREHVSLLRQPGIGKGDAVRHGYAHATGDILMILDADMTVAPEELPRFYRAIADGSGEFINGVRLVYPMESEAMRTLNYLGNKMFSLTFSWLLRQPVKDTLCGTKVLTRSSYDVIADNRAYFGEFDPFGDFDLLFGASKSNLKIVDLPIRYRDRTYGDTNIDRWRHGVLLLRMAAFAARKLRFV